MPRVGGKARAVERGGGGYALAMRSATRSRMLALGALALIVPLGFGLKAIRAAPDSAWRPVMDYLNNSLAGVAYEVFWCLVVFVLIPRRRAIGWICLGVFLATTALEFFQLFQPGPGHWLTDARRTFIGKAVLGNSFAWSDIPHYAAGCALGWVVLRAMVTRDGEIEEM